MDISSLSSSLQPESEKQQQQLQQLYQSQQQQQQEYVYDYSSSAAAYQQQQPLPLPLPHQPGGLATQFPEFSQVSQYAGNMERTVPYVPSLIMPHPDYMVTTQGIACESTLSSSPHEIHARTTRSVMNLLPKLRISWEVVACYDYEQTEDYATSPHVAELKLIARSVHFDITQVHVLDCDEARRQVNVQWIYLKGSGSHYRGGGRRGGASSRGGGRGNFGNKRPGSGGSGQPSGGQGRNKAKGVAKPKVASSMGNIGPNQQPGGGFRCEICDVECNSLEILENHKNGKKHQKLLLKIEAENKFPKPSTESQNMEQPTIGPNPKENCLSETTQEAEKGNQDEKESHEAEKDQQQQNSIAGPTGLTVGNGERGVKRKMPTGGKKIKTPNPSRRKIEPARQPKVVIPVVCDLCNVKCDTREVFEKHLAGKKHIGKLKRFEGHQNMYGPMGLQVLYPPNPIAQTHFDNGPSHSVYGGSQVSNPPISAYVPPQSYQAVGPAAPGGSDPYNPFNPAIVVTYEPDSQNGAHV
ncbi:hypothetical protein ACFE04_012571 [Oxalis oulophora]